MLCMKFDCASTSFFGEDKYKDDNSWRTKAGQKEDKSCKQQNEARQKTHAMVSVRLVKHGIILVVCVSAFSLLVVNWRSGSSQNNLLHKKTWDYIMRAKNNFPSILPSPDEQGLAHSGSTSQEQMVKRRFEHRLSLLHDACKLYHNTTVYRSRTAGFHEIPLYPPKMNVHVRYCPIAKTAATSWTTYLLGTVKDYMKKHKVQGSLDYKKAQDEIYFTFVREPYARMLSGYVDKLLTPNTLFWHITGKHAINLFRLNATKKSKDCGHDATFTEFVKFVVYAHMFRKHENGHFSPTHSQCDMCNISFRYIGHLETIKEDMPYIIKAMHSPVNASRTYDSETIVQNAKMVLYADRAKEVLKCMDLDEACRRLWKKYQIRGLISKTEKFPFKKGKAVNITLNTFVRVALAAHNRSQSNPNLKHQRAEALREAFSSVPLEDRLNAQHMLFLDFRMFGFDSMLEDVFPKTPYVPDKTFSYFQIYD